MCVCGEGGGGEGGLISGSLWYFRTSTPMLSGFNVECSPNINSNEIVNNVWNNVDCMDVGTNVWHHFLLYCYLIPLL